MGKKNIWSLLAWVWYSEAPISFHRIWTFSNVVKGRLQNSTKKVDLSLQDIKELPNALKGFYTLFYKFITQFYKQTAHFHSFWTKGSKFEAEKGLQKNKKRLEIAKTIWFFIHKHCTTHFSKPTIHFYKPIAHFHSFWTKSSKFEAGKIIQKWTIWVLF